ncbi:MAG: GcrA family cell cycle regulator [Rickettsiales bacterium]|nr:GcrA family cell cycle regulator [Rickettsiales bacterium]
MPEWTDKQIAKLKSLWDKGFSAAEIGKKLDVTKNSIIGKINRLGLSNRGSPIKPKTEKPHPAPAAASIPVQKAESKAPAKPVVQKPKKPADPPPKGVSLLELTQDRCCWPIDDVNSENFHFCGKKVFDGKPYCLEHCAIAYTNSATAAEEREANGEPPEDAEP